MEAGAREQTYELIRPLLEVGLELDEIRSLILLLGCEAIAFPGESAACLTRLVADRPPEVQAAWADMIGRMLALDPG